MVGSRSKVDERTVYFCGDVSEGGSCLFDFVSSKVKFRVFCFEVPSGSHVFIKDSKHLVVEKVDQPTGHLMHIYELGRVEVDKNFGADVVFDYFVNFDVETE